MALLALKNSQLRVPEPSTAASNGNRSSADPHRQDLLDQAAELNRRAQASAARGELSASAGLILAALDCERRAGGLGPQVLQLIKPRS